MILILNIRINSDSKDGLGGNQQLGEARQMEKMILILNVFNRNSKWRTKKRDLQLGQGRRGAKLEYCLPFKYTALGLLGLGDQKTCEYIERSYTLNTLFAHVDIKNKSDNEDS